MVKVHGYNRRAPHVPRGGRTPLPVWDRSKPFFVEDYNPSRPYRRNEQHAREVVSLLIASGTVK